MENKKYLVIVNAGKFLVKVQAGSLLSAEHAVLDLDGIQYAQAFGPEEVKTDTFAALVMQAEPVSLEELTQGSIGYRERWQEAAAKKEALLQAHLEYEEALEALEKAQEAERKADQEYTAAVEEARRYQSENMGMEEVY